MLFAALLQPAAVLIDHGHFQYNSISLGLAVSKPTEPFCVHSGYINMDKGCLSIIL